MDTPYGSPFATRLAAAASALERRFSLAAILALVLGAATLSAQAAAGSPTPVASQTGPAVSSPMQIETLDAARKELASLPAAEIAAWLSASIAKLAPSDAVQLLVENLDKVPSASVRAELCDSAADLCLLMGRFSDSASLYQRAAGLSPAGNPADLLKAARCEIAAGDDQAARSLAVSVLNSAPDGALAAQADLVEAWALFFSGRTAEANAAAQRILPSTSSQNRKECRFLVWISSEPQAQAGAAALLVKEFPGSPEALMAAGEMPLPPLPHWYLGMSLPLGPTSAAASPPAPESLPAASPNAPSAAVASPSGASASSPANAASKGGIRLQVGYFAVESNARALNAELASKGFDSGIEVKKTTPGSAEGTRWIVYVRGGVDPDATRIRLKDKGYESYPLD